MGVKSILESTKKVYGDLSEIYCGYGRTQKVSFWYGQPATNIEIDDFQSITKWLLPDDLLEFLKVNNGALLFDNPNLSGGPEVLSLNDIVKFKQFYEIGLETWYPIVDLGTGVILVDSERVRDGSSDYLLWLSKTISPEDAQYLGLNFETWLDRFILTHGSDFWLW